MDANLIPGIAIFVVLLIVVWVLSAYSNAVKARDAAEEEWSGIDVQLKRRRELVPNLVQTVQGHVAGQQEIFDRVLEARVIADAASVGGPRQAVSSENLLTASLARLFAVLKQHPELVNSESFFELQRELANIENQVVGSRSLYNSNAREYNDRIQSFPISLVAGPLGFSDFLLFDPTFASTST